MNTGTSRQLSDDVARRLKERFNSMSEEEKARYDEILDAFLFGDADADGSKTEPQSKP